MCARNGRNTQTAGVDHWDHSEKENLARPVCLATILITACKTEITWLAVPEITNSDIDMAKLGLMRKR